MEEFQDSTYRDITLQDSAPKQCTKDGLENRKTAQRFFTLIGHTESAYP